MNRVRIGKSTQYIYNNNNNYIVGIALRKTFPADELQKH